MARKLNRLQRAIRLLFGATRYDKAHHPEQVPGDRAAIDAVRGANVKPAPKPKPPPAPHGWMPGVVHEPVPFGSSDPTIIPVSVAQHIAVSNATSLQSQFEHDGGIESHFYVLKDGTIKQHRSIFVQCDAQFDGNGFGSPLKGAVSVEHQGGVGDDLFVPMPKAQLDAFHRIILFVRSQSPAGDLLFRVCPAWNAAGVGYHALFEEWNRSHHSCPGPARIKQFHDVTVPWLAQQRSKA